MFLSYFILSFIKISSLQLELKEATEYPKKKKKKLLLANNISPNLRMHTCSTWMNLRCVYFVVQFNFLNIF